MRANLLAMFLIFATTANVMRIYMGIPELTQLTKVSVGLSFGIIAVNMIGSFGIFVWQQWKER